VSLSGVRDRAVWSGALQSETHGSRHSARIGPRRFARNPRGGSRQRINRRVLLQNLPSSDDRGWANIGTAPERRTRSCPAPSQASSPTGWGRSADSPEPFSDTRPVANYYPGGPLIVDVSRSSIA